MQKSKNDTMPSVARRRTMSSTTLNRKYVKRPSKAQQKKVEDIAVKVRRVEKKSDDKSISSPRISHFADISAASPVNKVTMNEMMDTKEEVKSHPLHDAAKAKMKKRVADNSESAGNRATASEIKEQAIQKALREANASNKMTSDKSGRKLRDAHKLHFGVGKVFLALSCAAVAVFAIVYFVNLSMPDISLKVAAMQTGIDASYPSYIPRGYRISSITSENGKVTLEFVNDDGEAFSIVEESSSWDSNALMTNYVKESFGDDCSVIREQGLTIYANKNNAAWVNGGVVYKLKVTTGSLTNKQIRSIAVSMQ
ncbi:hypothetical protein IJG28_00315 [Candidatus Saccharibacteria bacterium]|nr:hypothetical protein [Candidatus Saccharibacteria bacterium]